MQMEFSAQELQYLDNLMERHMVGLIREINHTDSREYKQDLRNEADFLSHLKKRIEPHLAQEKVS